MCIRDRPYGLHAVPQHYDDEPITKTYPGTILFIGGENEPTSAVDQDPYNGDLGLGLSLIHIFTSVSTLPKFGTNVAASMVICETPPVAK